MSINELHPFSQQELANCPAESGVYVLFQLQIPLSAGSAENLRLGISEAKSQHPGATHFSIEVIGDPEQMDQRLADLQEQFKRVRSAGFADAKP